MLNGLVGHQFSFPGWRPDIDAIVIHLPNRKTQIKKQLNHCYLQRATSLHQHPIMSLATHAGIEMASCHVHFLFNSSCLVSIQN
jgi:hypothetical protein